MKKYIRFFITNAYIRKWIEKSFDEYIKVSWKNLNNREKDIALSVKTSFIMDIDKLIDGLK